uniref:Uncharacterized protein n=1 Tax=Cacopsylla melanoneura TaxID=428564 RepID=A0A8D9BEN7_9HEMI
MESRMKRRSSFFRRDPELEDGSMSTTASETITNNQEDKDQTIANQIISQKDKDLLREQYIQELKAEQRAWKEELNQSKIQYLKLKKEAKNPVMKTSKSDLWAMLSEKEKQEYGILFNDTDYSPLIQSIDTLKKKIIILSVTCEHNASLVKQCMQEHAVHNQAMFENFVNQISVLSNTARDEIEWSDGESIDDCLDSEDSEREEMDL